MGTQTTSFDADSSSLSGRNQALTRVDASMHFDRPLAAAVSTQDLSAPIKQERNESPFYTTLSNVPRLALDVHKTPKQSRSSTTPAASTESYLSSHVKRTCYPLYEYGHFLTRHAQTRTFTPGWEYCIRKWTCSSNRIPQDQVARSHAQQDADQPQFPTISKPKIELTCRLWWVST